MTTQKARKMIIEHWFAIAEKHVGYSLHIEDARTVEHEWGWVFFFGPADPQVPKRIEAYALDRMTGESIPVGTKGLEHAVYILKSWRRQFGIEGNDQGG